MRCPLWGMLLEDQLELMLRRKLGAKIHGISHRLLLQRLPLLLRAIQLPAQGTEVGTGHGCLQFYADAVP